MEVEKIENIGDGGEGRNFSHFLHKKKPQRKLNMKSHVLKYIHFVQIYCSACINTCTDILFLSLHTHAHVHMKVYNLCSYNNAAQISCSF